MLKERRHVIRCPLYVLVEDSGSLNELGKRFNIKTLSIEYSSQLEAIGLRKPVARLGMLYSLNTLALHAEGRLVFGSPPPLKRYIDIRVDGPPVVLAFLDLPVKLRGVVSSARLEWLLVPLHCSSSKVLLLASSGTETNIVDMLAKYSSIVVRMGQGSANCSVNYGNRVVNVYGCDPLTAATLLSSGEKIEASPSLLWVTS